MAIAINGTGTLTGISVGGLPDGIVDTDMLAANAVTAAKASGSVKGMTMADQWRLTTNLSLSATTTTVITSNWERPDQTGWAYVGTGMSESSGVFTFPETGIYKISYFPLWDTSTTISNAWSYINCTTDGTNYTEFALACVSMQSGQMSSTALETYFDVTNVSTHKVKFSHYGSAACIVSGNTNANRTSATFIRLGDT